MSAFICLKMDGCVIWMVFGVHNTVSQISCIEVEQVPRVYWRTRQLWPCDVGVIYYQLVSDASPVLIGKRLPWDAKLKFLCSAFGVCRDKTYNGVLILQYTRPPTDCIQKKAECHCSGVISSFMSKTNMSNVSLPIDGICWFCYQNSMSWGTRHVSCCPLGISTYFYFPPNSIALWHYSE